MEDFFESVDIKGQRADQLSPLLLAYIGDAVFEILVRNYVIEDNSRVNDLHKKSTSLVSAKAQKQWYTLLFPMLTEQEAAVLKRGRNAKSPTKAKNATAGEYSTATGLEALFGYLFLSKQFTRISELFEVIKDNYNKI